MSGTGKYRLDARLGGGGMAEVFIGSTVGAEGFTRKVAIKKVLPGFSDNPQFSQMFVTEAQISSRLQHPNIVSVMDFDRDEEARLFLVMEMVEGKDLDALMSTGLLPFQVVIYVITEALRGLGYAHDLPVGADVRGVVHRDVSPHNVLLSWEGAVKVSDFGIAKAKAASEATASVFIKGKPAYMSPEQANGQVLDGRSDLFAVGVMLWEMLVGRRLFSADDTRATLAAVLFGQIQRPRTLRSDIPKDLERITMKLLERDLPNRYATADDAIGELLDCADAPRNGRDALRNVLAERYPHQMPMRQSSLSGRSGSVTPTGAPSGTPTNPFGASTSAPIPSVSAAMSAQTSTMMPNDGTRPGSKSTRLALIIGVTVVSAILAFAIVSGLRKTTPTTGSNVAAAAPIDAAAAIATPPPPPAPVDAAPAAPIAIDAAPIAIDAAAPAATVDAGTHPVTPPPTVKKTGTLHAEGFPVLDIFVDGAAKGQTPRDVKLPVGKHTVRLASPKGADDPYDRSQVIEIKEGSTVSVKRS